jgi:hypothetical protein
MALVKILIGLLVAALLVVAAVLIGARFGDGPLEIVAGGPFTSGERYQGQEPDWDFVANRPTVEFQLLEPARSRTSWIVEHEGSIYIPSGYMNTTWGRIWKQWPIEAERDGRALLRVDDTVYERQLIRIKEGPAVAPVVAKLTAKYFGGGDLATEDGMQQVATDSLWLFEVAPPAP